MALYTVAESASSLVTGAAFDLLRVSVHGLCLVLSVITAATLAIWVLYALREARRGGGTAQRGPAYAPLPTAGGQGQELE